MTYAVAVGNPFDGMILYGPFPESEDAANFTDGLGGGPEWAIVEMLPADEEGMEFCPVCGQPDNCGDCTHEPVGWTVEFRGGGRHDAWALVNPMLEPDDSYWYDSREEAQRAADIRNEGSVSDG